MKIRAIILIMPLIFAGCTTEATGIASAQKYREWIGEGSAWAKKTVITVDRSHAEIGKNWAERSDACIDNSKLYSGRYNANIFFKTKTLISKQKAELHLQQKIYAHRLTHSDKEPEDGFYAFVADAIVLTPNKSRIEINYKLGDEQIAAAVSNWATGKNMGCPDLTQNPYW